MNKKQLPAKIETLKKQWNKSRDPRSYSSYTLHNWIHAHYNVTFKQALELAEKLLKSW